MLAMAIQLKNKMLTIVSTKETTCTLPRGTQKIYY